MREKLDKANRDNPEREHYIDIDIEECTYTKLKLEVFYDPESKDEQSKDEQYTLTQEDAKELIDFDGEYFTMTRTEGATFRKTRNK